MVVADMLFTGGRVFVGDGMPLDGHAVAILDGRVLGVLPAEDTGVITGPHTLEVDLAGALLAPGFQSAHMHPIDRGRDLLHCRLDAAIDSTEVIALVGAFADANPDEEWISGGGWSGSQFTGGTPTRHLLDRAVPDRPAVLLSRDGRSAWANTPAIEIAAVDASTPDPPGGTIVREADGFPAGTFHDAAIALVSAAATADAEELTYRALLAAQDELLALGVTGWRDAVADSSAESREAYRRAAREGLLLARVSEASTCECGPDGRESTSRDQGAPLQGGADPIEAIHVAVNQGRAIDIAAAMAAQTSGTARLSQRDHDTGWIREGYVANLVVLSPDPFALPAEQVRHSSVSSTWIEGHPAYVAPSPARGARPTRDER